MRGKVRPWNAAELTRARTLREQGKSAAEIGRALNRTECSVAHRLKPSGGREAPTNKRGSYAATIPCMCCERPFSSWDRRKNRLCYTCAKL